LYLGKAIRRVAVVAASGLLLTLGLTVVSHTIQLAFLMSTIHPWLGIAAFAALIVTHAAVVAVPVVLYMRLPPSLVLPESDSVPEFEAYLAELRSRLKSNRHFDSTTSLRIGTRSTGP
jgi:hypothetical protein